MSFDDCREDAYESHPCPECGGEAVLEDGHWICLEKECTWSAEVAG